MKPQLLSVTVKPGSKRPGVTMEGATIVVRVAERAVEGAANAGCVRALAERLRVAPTSITLARGAKARRKSFALAGIGLDEAVRRLRESDA